MVHDNKTLIKEKIRIGYVKEEPMSVYTQLESTSESCSSQGGN